MTNFYDAIAAHYDHIFPTGLPQVEFVTSRVRAGGRILDVGCATGGLGVALARAGYSVSGVDLDAPMIALAKDKAAKSDLAVNFFEGDMTRLSGEETFDGVVCLGNTLVHLDESGVMTFLEWAGSALAPGGRLMMQILNYARIEAERIEALPLIENEAIKFERTYRRAGGALLFHTVLTVKATTESIENEIQLYPLQKEKLARLLAQAGFGEVSYFGDLKGSPFDPTSSFPLVLVAAK